VQGDISNAQTMLSTSRLSVCIYHDLINFMPAKYLMNSYYSSTNEPQTKKKRLKNSHNSSNNPNINKKRGGEESKYT